MVEALGGNIEIGTHRRWGTRVIFSIVVKEKFCEQYVTLKDVGGEQKDEEIVITDLMNEGTNIKTFEGCLD